MAIPWGRQTNFGSSPYQTRNPYGFPPSPGGPMPPWNDPYPPDPRYLAPWAPGYPPPPAQSPWGWNSMIPPDDGFGQLEDPDDFPWADRNGPILPYPPYDPRHVLQVAPRTIPPQLNFNWNNTPGTGQIPLGIYDGPDIPFAPIGVASPFQGGPPPPNTFPFNRPTAAEFSNGPPLPITFPFSSMPMGPSPFPFSPMPMPMTPGTPGMDIKPVLFARKDPYEGEYVAARPSDWRHDYTPPRRFAFLSRFRRAGADRGKINLEHSHLSPMLLMPNSKIPVMSFDLRSDQPFDPSNLELLTTAGRPFNHTDLSQFATTRPVQRLRFYHPRLPWCLDVRASQPNGILVGDVLHQIHEKLHRAIRPPDFSNTVLDATDRELVTDAYRNRCEDRVDIMQQGVRRVDFMGSDVILQGFIEGRDGMWLMKTTPYSRNVDG
ncbi:hypothetical protein B0H19DRAFT_1100772 [Mycena capillaripes]|nr:hypothetical protein B0H19DRAFT_1100772 [Mycena capillaripes]